MVIAGIIVVIVAVLGGYVMHHEVISVLIQPSEFLIILGAAAGSVLISTPMNVMKQIVQSFGKIFGGGKGSKEAYFELLTLLYEIFRLARKDGLLFLEQHVGAPDKSSIFSKYPGFLKNHHVKQFLIDTLKVMLVGINPSDVEALLDAELESHHEEAQRPVTIISKVGDAMPGLGIVAAVLGIVITMQGIDGPAEEIGKKVAAALVGTFLGVLCAYGFISPMATNLEMSNLNETNYLQCIKAGLMAFAKDTPPLVAVELARRTIYSDMRPGYEELNKVLRSKK